MNNKFFLRLLIITIILAFLDIILFSPGIYGLTFAMNPLFFSAMILLNGIVLVGEIVYIGNSTTAKYGYDLDKLKDVNDYKQALEKWNTKNSPFSNEIKQATSQIISIDKKTKVLNELLEQNNKQHFTALVDLGNQASSFLVNNIRKILNRIAIYDADVGDDLLDEHKKYIQNLIVSNENILTEFNKLLTEVSQLDDTSTDDSLSKVLSDMTSSLKTLRGDNM